MTLPYKIIACDLDGTLLAPDQSVHPEDITAIARARAAGLHVAICTGRNSRECGRAVQAAGFTGLGVFSNGSIVADMVTGRARYHKPLDAALVDELLDFFGAFGHAVLMLADDPETRLPVYIQSEHGPLHRGSAEWLVAHRLHALVQNPIEPRYRDRMVRASIVIDIKDALPIEQALTARFGARLTSYSLRSHVYDCQVIDVFHPQVNKWTGLLQLCQELGTDPTHVVTIGDDLNDLPMLENATLSFAMGNAAPAVIQSAKRTTLPQSQGGVAQVIDAILAGRDTAN